MMTYSQVMREYTSKVDKLEEAENQRAEEVKEENNKPIVMGECCQLVVRIITETWSVRVVVWVSMWLWLLYIRVTAR